VDIYNQGFTDNDIFLWRKGDASGGSVDTIMDFETWNGSEGDRLDISGLLESFETHHLISDRVNIETGLEIRGVNNSSRLIIDVDGAGGVLQIIDLVGVDLSNDSAETLRSQGVLIADRYSHIAVFNEIDQELLSTWHSAGVLG